MLLIEAKAFVAGSRSHEVLGYETEGIARRIAVPERLIRRADNFLRWMLIRLNTQGNHRLLADYLAQKWANLRHRLGAVGE